MNAFRSKKVLYHGKKPSKKLAKPLLEQKIIEPEYPGYIISNVHEFGPYIVIAPEICIPHAQEGKGVNDTAVAFMNIEEAVRFWTRC